MMLPVLLFCYSVSGTPQCMEAHLPPVENRYDCIVTITERMLDILKGLKTEDGDLPEFYVKQGCIPSDKDA